VFIQQLISISMTTGMGSKTEETGFNFWHRKGISSLHKASKLAIDPTQPPPNKYWRHSRQCMNPTSHFQILTRLRRLEMDRWHSSTKKEIRNILMKPKPVMEYNMNAVHHQHWRLASAPVIRHNTDGQCMYKHNSGARLHNHRSSGQALSIIYSECESIALVTQHASICNILSSVVCLAPPYYSTFSYWTQNVCSDFLYKFVWNISRSKKNWTQYYHKCT
jgi:hypothetical protein